MLKQMWQEQKQFNELVLGCPVEEIKDLRHWNNFYTLALHKEVSEFLDETDWKVHRGVNSQQGKMSNKVEEAVDILKYWMSLCQVHGITDEMIVDEFKRKSMVVQQRFQQERLLQLKGRKVVGVDIDGILANYPRSLVDFMNSEQCRQMIPELNSWGEFDPELATTYNIFNDYGIEREVANKVKHLYRETGYKRQIPVYDDAKQFLDTLRAKGYVISLVTSRPYHEYNRIFADTMDWLNDNELQYDVVLWAEDKGTKITEEFGVENIEFFVDDVADYANSVADRGIRTYLMNKTYNQDNTINSDIVRVNCLHAVLMSEGLM